MWKRHSPAARPAEGKQGGGATWEKELWGPALVPPPARSHTPSDRPTGKAGQRCWSNSPKGQSDGPKDASTPGTCEQVGPVEQGK